LSPYGLVVGAAAMIEVAIMRGAPLQTVCVPPDGTRGYGRADVANIESRSERREITPAEAQKMIEDNILIALAGPIIENLYAYVSFADCPELFPGLYDRLGALPETSPLALLVDEDDPALTRIQDLVIDLLNSRGDLEEALQEALKERHFLTPADIRALMEAQERGDEGSGPGN